MRSLGSRALSVALGAVLLSGGAPAAGAASGTVTVLNTSGNGIATGAVVRADPANALVTVTNGFHFWAAIEVTYPAGGKVLSPAAEDAGGAFAVINLIGPGSTAAWTGTFVPGSMANVRIHYDLTSAEAAEALAANILTMVVDGMGIPLVGKPTLVQTALKVLIKWPGWVALVQAVAKSDLIGTYKSMQVLLGTETGRAVLMEALAALGMIVTMEQLKAVASGAALFDMLYTLFDIYRATILGHNDGTAIFSVAAPVVTAPPTPKPTPTAQPTPSPPPELMRIQDLIAEPHPRTSADEVVSVMKVAFALSPEKSIWITGDKPPKEPDGRKREAGFVYYCANKAPGMAVQDQASGCMVLVWGLYQRYTETKLPQFYRAALSVYNFSMTSFAPDVTKPLPDFLLRLSGS
jgi:hypothetical protein